MTRTPAMIRKLKSGQYRLYSRKINPKTGKRRNLGTFPTRAKAEQHERAVQYSARANAADVSDLYDMEAGHAEQIASRDEWQAHLRADPSEGRRSHALPAR